MNYLSKIGFLHSLLNMQYPIYIKFFISLAYFFICLIIKFPGFSDIIILFLLMKERLQGLSIPEITSSNFNLLFN